ncbi:redoxin family protein [Paludibacterium yongneupense]|uniref:redoxin family protein n=1 Tax=Paludibacterium yongneupense TaxID=400061 RepID=UPI0003F78A5C|nr:redoxin family protein [Paludibacterium yongneupense]
MDQFTLVYGEETLPVSGDFPILGQTLPSFMLVDDKCSDVALEHFGSRPKAILTLLSLDEDSHGGLRLLQNTLRQLERWPDLQLIVITVDSPSTLRRARKEHGLPHAILLSTLRGRDFHKRYGVLITEYPLAGYTAPALILADGDNRVLYSERLHDTQADFNFDAIAARFHALELARNAAKQARDATGEESGG